MVVELHKEIRQVVDLSEAELQFNQQLLNMVNVTACLTPFHTEITQ